MIKLKNARVAYVPYVSLGHTLKNYANTVTVTIVTKSLLKCTIVAVTYKRYQRRR